MNKLGYSIFGSIRKCFDPPSFLPLRPSDVSNSEWNYYDDNIDSLVDLVVQGIVRDSLSNLRPGVICITLDQMLKKSL